MKTLPGRHVLVLFLFLALLLAVQLLAQDATNKTPLPVPLSPVVTLNSSIDDNGDETGNFTIVSPNITQFANAETVDWLAVNASTRGEAEGSLAPSEAGTITVEAEDLEYEDGHVISFSLVQIAALDDATYTDSPRLIFCYPVHESCDDPETIIRSLPPPLNANIILLTPVPTATPDPNAQAQTLSAQTSDNSGTFEVNVPLVGNVITNAQGFGWSADNSDGNSASGTENLGNGDSQAQAQAQTDDSVETIHFGANLVQYDVGDILRIILRSLAQEDSSRYVDSHPVVYYFCEDPENADPDCAALWASTTGGNNNNGNNSGSGSGTGGGSSSSICLNTDNAAPIKVCANADYTQYTLLGVFQDSSTTELVTVSSASSLCGSNAAADASLASGTNSAANKAYTVSYDGDCTMTLSTFYADKGPDVDKPYVITIDEHHTVVYVQW